MIWLLLYALFHLACGVIGYGMAFDYFQREFPNIAEEMYAEDRWLATVGFGMGPVGIIAAWNIGWHPKKHGLKFF
jgi:hypothetical protein